MPDHPDRCDLPDEELDIKDVSNLKKFQNLKKSYAGSITQLEIAEFHEIYCEVRNVSILSSRTTDGTTLRALIR